MTVPFYIYTYTGTANGLAWYAHCQRLGLTGDDLQLVIVLRGKVCSLVLEVWQPTSMALKISAMLSCKPAARRRKLRLLLPIRSRNAAWL